MRIACCAAEDLNMGLGYVMAHLKEQGHEVKLFFDPRQGARGYFQNRFAEWLLNIEDKIVEDIYRYNPEMCCFSPVSAAYVWSLRMAEKIKRKCPNVKIVFGGIHTTLVPEEVKKHSFIDEIVIGDGIAHFGGKFDPDKLWPDRESFLKELPPIHRKYQLFMTSIGCPMNCNFCCNNSLRQVKEFKYIRRSPKACIEELKHLKERGMRYVLFVDDIFTIDKSFLHEFLPRYRREINLPFTCFGHAQYITDEIVAELRMSKCKAIWLGIQTGDQGLRKEILNRRETNQEILDACAIIKKHGLKLIVDHIFGIPYESVLSQDISYNMYMYIKADIVNCYNLVYFPKAEIIKPALLAGNLTAMDVEKIKQGGGTTYQIGKNTQFYNTYAKAMVALPVGGYIAEMLPMWLIKLLVYLKAGRLFTPIAMIQNEIFFTWRAIWKKIF